MRRAAHHYPVSPKMLKHFAAASVVITALLATLAGGDDEGVSAHVQATQARNDLIAAEQKKLGTRKIASHLKVRTAGSGFGDDGGGDFGGGDGGGGFSSAASPGPKRGSLIASPNGPAVFAPPTMPKRADGRPPRKRIVKPGEPGAGANSGDTSGQGPAPTAENLARAMESSRARSGSADSSGD